MITSAHAPRQMGARHGFNLVRRRPLWSRNTAISGTRVQQG